jgi:hypothetical protein
LFVQHHHLLHQERRLEAAGTEPFFSKRQVSGQLAPA